MKHFSNMNPNCSAFSSEITTPPSSTFPGQCCYKFISIIKHIFFFTNSTQVRQISWLTVTVTTVLITLAYILSFSLRFSNPPATNAIIVGLHFSSKIFFHTNIEQECTESFSLEDLRFQQKTQLLGYLFYGLKGQALYQVFIFLLLLISVFMVAILVIFHSSNER